MTTHPESQDGENADVVLMVAQEISNLLVSVRIRVSALGVDLTMTRTATHM
jgi:hypothetical protein